MKLLKKIFPYSLSLLAICGILDALPFKIPLIINWGLTFIVFISIYQVINQIDKNIKFSDLRPIKIYLCWNVICILRGCFVAEIYWDWKLLIATGFGMLMPILCYIFIHPYYLSFLYKNLLKSYIIVFLIILIFSESTDRAGRYLTFFYLFMLCIYALPKKWKIITLIVFLFSCLYELDARSNIIRAFVATAIGIMFYFRHSIITIILKKFQLIFLCIPIIFFTLAVTGVFNIFKMDEYMENINVSQNHNGEKQEINLTADTRTLLYEEVIISAIKNNKILFGSTPARGYESVFFSQDTYESKQLNIRSGERHGTEVSILNVFIHTGLIGVILYFIVFFYSSYLAIYKSHNFYIKLIGLFVIFRWNYAWIEDFNQFDINYATLWMFIAMCISPYFRKMSNVEFKQWILTTIPK